jgi:hypothetical protein
MGITTPCLRKPFRFQDRKMSTRIWNHRLAGINDVGTLKVHMMTGKGR